jgi:hypothetical protein
MTFKDEVVKPAGGDFSPFKQGWYSKTDAGAIPNENLATLDQPGRRAPSQSQSHRRITEKRLIAASEAFL